MRQFDVHRNLNPATARARPYLLIVQSDLIGELPTRVVVPLADRTKLVPVAYLHPVFIVEARSVVMSTSEIAGIRNRDIGEKVTSLAAKRDEVIAAIDFLVAGF